MAGSPERGHAKVTSRGRARIWGQGLFLVLTSAAIAGTLLWSCASSTPDLCGDKDCEPGGFCFTDGMHSYCACPGHLVPDDGQCVPNEGCAAVACSRRGQCVEADGLADRCECNPGYSVTVDGFHCLPENTVRPDADGDADSDTDRDSDADPDTDRDGDTNPTAGFVRALGSETCQATRTVIEIGGTVPVGHMVIVRAGFRSVSDEAVSATDDAGNTYEVDARAFTDDGRGALLAVLSAHVTTELRAGDQIAVTHPDAVSSAVSVEEYQGLAAADRVHVAGSVAGESLTPGASIQTTEPGTFLYSATTSHGEATLALVAPWHLLEEIVADCPLGHGHSRHRAAHLDAPTAGTYEYSPSLSYDTVWATVLVAYSTE